MVELSSVVIIALILLTSGILTLLMYGVNVRVLKLTEMIFERIETLESRAAEMLEIPQDDFLGRLKGIMQIFQDFNQNSNPPDLDAKVIEVTRGADGKFGDK